MNLKLSASASNMIRQLEERGYLQRQACPKDARAQLLFPSDKALTLKQKESQVYEEATHHFTQVLTEQELKQLTQLLHKACIDLNLGDIVPPQITQPPYSSEPR